jgi:hypothetical protein
MPQGTFSPAMDVFLAALAVFRNELEANRPSIDQAIADADQVALDKAAAAVSASAASASATSALNAPGTNATTTTSITPAAGAISFTLAQTGKAYSVGQWLVVASAAAATTKWVLGQISAFTAATGATTIQVPGGSFAGTTFSDGVVSLGASAGTLPGQGGNAGKVLTTNGATASWGNTLTSATLASPTITGGATVDTVSASGAVAVGAGFTMTGSTKQNVTAVAAAALDLSTADFFTKSISANTTFTFTNPTAGKAQGFMLDLTISSAAVPTWPATVKWEFGTTPPLGNGRHILGFITDDGGTTYVGVLGAQAVA